MIIVVSAIKNEGFLLRDFFMLVIKPFVNNIVGALSSSA